jgi:hypothetical protein
VLTTADATIPALTPGATQDVSAEGKAEGITAWRYRVK